MERRRFRRTDHQSTRAIFGAAAFYEISKAEADKAIEKVIAAGVNHIDMAPGYGQAEERLGPWMPLIHECFTLGCKTMKRQKADATAELRRSLEMLRVDKFDLFQLHAITSVEEMDQVTKSGSAIDTVIEARAEGLTESIGITVYGNHAPAVFL